jgi:hypothetical protein
MMAVFDAYVLFENITTVNRICPFCQSVIEDSLGESKNFVPHLAAQTARHIQRKEWGDYIALVASGSKGPQAVESAAFAF